MNNLLAILLIVVGPLFLVVFLGITSIAHHYQREAVKHGCAQYNSSTASFEWKK